MNKKLLKNLIFIFLILFFIPLKKTTAIQATLKIAHNDGIQCYLNGYEFINTLNEGQTERYWNKEIDVSNYLRANQNLLACRVSNGDGNPGTGIGYFDVELVINSQIIIQRGSSGWKYFGSAGSTTPPPDDAFSRKWFAVDYNDSSWPTASTPFDGRSGPVLKRAPDDAWFRKFFSLSSQHSSGQSSSGNCSLITNQTECLNRSCYWINSACWESREDFSNQTAYRIKNLSRNGCWQPTIHRLDHYLKPSLNLTEFIFESPKPLITGLVKYGNQIEIYVNDKPIGKAIVKEGELTGVANFYFKPKTNLVSTDEYLIPQKLKIVAFNPYDGSVCQTKDLIFIIRPYPAPIIHRLGEIPYVFQADRLIIKTKKPLITGLVKYGSVVDIFIDEKFVGRANVKEGKNTGVANFYFTLKDPLTPGEHRLYAIAKKANQEDIVSLPSQVFYFTVKE